LAGGAVGPAGVRAGPGGGGGGAGKSIAGAYSTGPTATTDTPRLFDAAVASATVEVASWRFTSAAAAGLLASIKA
jgi:hypothetical protein